jgi:hypothetical protein
VSDRGNIVIANLYGRGVDGKMVPVRVAPDGTMSGGGGTAEISTITDWTTVNGIAVLTPLVAWTPFADNSNSLLFGFKNEASSAETATFTLQTSEDGVLPCKGLKYLYDLDPGEHDVFVSPTPLLRRYWRLSVTPLAAGPINASFIVRHIPR